MRAACETQPLTTRMARGFLSGREEMPAWLSELLAASVVQAAEREARAQAEALEVAHRLLLVEERVRAKLGAGERRFHGDERAVVEEWAWEAARELVRNDGEVGELEGAVLRSVGVDAHFHATWPLHVGGCDGAGAESCDARIAELAAQRFEELGAARHERRERAQRDSELIASGAFRVGQPVLAYYGLRAGVVTKVNRVTVKVKHVGATSDHYDLVERNYSPAYLNPLPDTTVAAVQLLGTGQSVDFLDWTRRRRRGDVADIEGPLLQVEYRLASGQARTAWIDVLHLDVDDGGRSW